MKKKIMAVFLVFAMCFAFAGCGGDSGDSSDKSKEPEKAKATSIIGSWECEDIEVTDNGEKIDKETIKTMFGKDFSATLKIDAYSDGQAYITLMGDEGVLLWTETGDKTYKIDSDKEDSSEMTAKLDGEKLIVNMKEAYMSGDEEVSMEMKFTMKYLGKKSKLGYEQLHGRNGSIC